MRRNNTGILLALLLASTTIAPAVYSAQGDQSDAAPQVAPQRSTTTQGQSGPSAPSVPSTQSTPPTLPMQAGQSLQPNTPAGAGAQPGQKPPLNQSAKAGKGKGKTKSKPKTAPVPGMADDDEDYTDKITMTPGLRLVFPIKDGLDTRWKRIGDYNFIAELEPVKEGFSYTWTMTAPANASGRRAVAPEDVLNAHQVSLFYPDKQTCTMMGYTNTVRVSDNLYQDIKSGELTRFELDGPDSPMVYHKETIPLPHAIKLVGEEKLRVSVNNVKVPVRTIKAQTDNGWHYWILDNPQFPIILKGEGPFRWDEPEFNYPGPIASGDGDSIEEGQRIVRQLEKTGEATTHAILFDFDKATLKPKSKKILNEIGKYLKAHAEVRLGVEGHTDNIGTSQYNIGLSNRRAASVKTYLVKSCSIKASRLAPKGFGFTKPIADNSIAAGRAQNRRVVFKKL